MTKQHLELRVSGDRVAICRLHPQSELPAWAISETFLSVTRTADELSIVCPEQDVPEGTRCQRNWRSIKVSGPLDFEEVGVLSALAGPLAEASISVFVISTYDTDFLLVKEETLEHACQVLRRYGHRIEPPRQPKKPKVC